MIGDEEQGKESVLYFSLPETAEINLSKFEWPFIYRREPAHCIE